MHHLILMFILLLVVSSCNRYDDTICDCFEFIPTLNYVLTPANGGTPVTLSFQDLDGDGGDVPIITSGTLAANTTYSGNLELFDESGLYRDDVAAEIAEEEDEEYQFFYQTTDGINIAYNDTDVNGNPIGIRSTLTTGAAGNGIITIILLQEPDKNGSGVSDGDIANAGGETVIEVTFDVTIM